MRHLAGVLWGVGLLIIGFPSARAAQSQTPPKTFSIDSGYIPSWATNRSMHNLWIEYEGLGSGIFDFFGENLSLGRSFPTRILLSGGMYFGWDFANYTFFVANHELGHGSRALAAGFSPTYQWNGATTHKSIFTFILQGYGQYNNGAATASGGSTTTFPTDWATVVSAGGMNNSMMFAEALEDEVLYNTGHINQFRAYLRGKLDAYNYVKASNGGSGDDVQSMVNYYGGQGYSISKNDISIGSLAATIISSTSFAYAYSYLKYFASGDPSVKPLAIGAVKLPDISFFQNRSGLSLRLRSAIMSDKHAFPLSVEYVYKGRARAEFSLGYRLIEPLNGIGKTGGLVQGYVNTVGGIGARIFKDFPLGQSSYVTVGGSAFTVSSLEGERNLGKLLSNTLGVEGWGKWTLRL
jgi:hypothetical protein